MQVLDSYKVDPMWLIQTTSFTTDCKAGGTLHCENASRLNSMPDLVRNVFLGTYNGAWVSLSNEGFMAFVYWTLRYFYAFECADEMIEQILNQPEKEGLSLINYLCHINIKSVEGAWYSDQEIDANGKVKNLTSRSLAERGLRCPTNL